MTNKPIPIWKAFNHEKQIPFAENKSLFPVTCTVIILILAFGTKRDSFEATLCDGCASRLVMPSCLNVVLVIMGRRVSNAVLPT